MCESESRCRDRNCLELGKKNRKNTTKAVFINTCCLRKELILDLGSNYVYQYEIMRLRSQVTTL